MPSLIQLRLSCEWTIFGIKWLIETKAAALFVIEDHKMKDLISLDRSMPHPSDDTLRLFAACQLDENREDEIERHLAECTDCRQRLVDFERQDQSPILQEMRAAGQDAPPDSDDLDFPTQTGDAGGGFSPGDLIGGKYRLKTLLGRGGMGVAWKAFDEKAGRQVVLKFVPKEIQHVAEAMNAVRESFHRVEALQHQHICPLYDLADDANAGLFLVMKFVDGLTLGEYRRQYAENRVSMPFEEIVRILRAMAEALDYAHARKVIHRDIKPQNIMIGVTDGVQIIDFGLADEIRSSMERFSGAAVAKMSGTRPYMAPEQWQGKPQDARTDQYALAVTAYELLAGYVPFRNSDFEVLRNCVLNELPTPIPNLPEHVNAALLRGLAKDRNDRFENCTAFVDTLEKPDIDTALTAKAKTAPWKWLLPAIRIGAVLILAVVAFFVVRHYLKPIENTDVPSVEHESERLLVVGRHPIIEPEKLPSNSIPENAKQIESQDNVEESKPQTSGGQSRQRINPSVIHPPRNEMFVNGSLKVQRTEE